MTYYEAYLKLSTIEEIQQMAERDSTIAYYLGNNPDRIKAIEEAMNKAILIKELEDNNE